MAIGAGRVRSTLLTRDPVWYPALQEFLGEAKDPPPIICHRPGE